MAQTTEEKIKILYESGVSKKILRKTFEMTPKELNEIVGVGTWGPRKVDLLGKRFGSLTVQTRLVNKQGHDGGQVWGCVCVCGKEVELTTNEVKRKKFCSRECGARSKRQNNRRMAGFLSSILNNPKAVKRSSENALPSTEEWMEARDIALKLKVSEAKVAELAREGKIPFLSVGPSRRRFKMSEVEEALRQESRKGVRRE